METGERARTMVERVRSRPWGLAVAALAGGTVELAFEPGADAVDERSSFQIGSVTKTMTGVLFADAVQRGEVGEGTTVGSLLGFDGGAADVTLAALATQRSGLPRLPPNLDPAAVDPADPYARYALADLVEGLRAVDVGPPQHEYSNFGFMTLGACLAAAAGRSMGGLLAKRLFAPLGMTTAGCPPPEDGRLPGYAGADPTPWWTTALPGAGGVGASIADVAAYLAAHLEPPAGALGDAIRTATTVHAAGVPPMGYGWIHQGGGWWHNGGTGGFRSFVAFHAPSATGVALLANSGGADGLDAVGFLTLTEMIAAS
jgi:CubicO group peptidase (beta-lactamase class C family)